MTFMMKDITSQDVTLGVRWQLDKPAGLRAAAAGHQGLIGPLVIGRLVMPALVAGIHVFESRHVKGVDGRRP